MNIPESCLKPFPAYEDVFADDLENCKKHFLPLCSINLQCVFPEQDEWLHIVSVKEIYEGCVGEDTQEYHTAYTKEDMLSFDVSNGKYKFEADWNYFLLNQQEQKEAEYEELKAAGDKQHLRLRRDLGQLSELEQAYTQNENDYNSRKQFYALTNAIYPFSSIGETFDSVDELIADIEKKRTDGWGFSYPEINGILDDVAFQSDETQKFMQEYDVSIEEMRRFENTNLINRPLKENGEVFTYIGSLTGYLFQAYGAGSVHLFYDQELKKAVICFEYT